MTRSNLAAVLTLVAGGEDRKTKTVSVEGADRATQITGTSVAHGLAEALIASR